MMPYDRICWNIQLIPIYMHEWYLLKSNKMQNIESTAAGTQK